MAVVPFNPIGHSCFWRKRAVMKWLLPRERRTDGLRLLGLHFVAKEAENLARGAAAALWTTVATVQAELDPPNIQSAFRPAVLSTGGRDAGRDAI